LSGGVREKRDRNEVEEVVYSWRLCLGGGETVGTKDIV